MENDLKCNADRFMGFGDIYDDGRPQCPEKVKELILRYLPEPPGLVVDIGCGTGLSTRIWSNTSSKVIGVEPSADMIKTARGRSVHLKNIEFIQAFADDTGLDNGCADVVTCSQAFHWMNPETTLNEVSRILKDGGVLAVYDYNWPPVCGLEAEMEYNKLSKRKREIESTPPKVKDSFVRRDKKEHLSNMKNSGKFRYVREIFFSVSGSCTARKFIGSALGHGGLQAVIKAEPDKINPCIKAFEKKIYEIFGDEEFEIETPYQLRIGVK